jgi:ABC-type polysaccharide/polyol phosphate export permease
LKAFSITYYYIIDDINTLSLIHHYVMRDVCQTYLQNHLGVVWLSLTGN